MIQFLLYIYFSHLSFGVHSFNIWPRISWKFLICLELKIYLLQLQKPVTTPGLVQLLVDFMEYTKILA